MTLVRFYRTEELPQVLQRAVATAAEQLVPRDLPGASSEGVARQLYRMYQMALQTPQAALLVMEWPQEVAHRKDGLAGHLLLMPQPNPFTGEREGMILDVYIHATLRGLKLGKLILKKAEEYARQIGCTGLVAQVAIHNQASLRLFASADFASERIIVGRRF